MNNSNRIFTYALAAFAVSCSSSADRDNATAKDASGNYATTSQFNANYRREFVTSIRAGLDDADKRTRELESRATQLGQKSLTALHEQLPGISQKRTAVVNELTRLEAAMDNDWPLRRDDTDTAYKSLRTVLDKAYTAVLGE